MKNTRKTSFYFILAGLIAASFGNIASVPVHAAENVQRAVEQADDGSIRLDAGDATIEGPNAKLEERDAGKDIIWWTSEDTFLHWTAKVRKPGKYRVELNYSLFGVNNGRELVIAVGDQMINATPKAGRGVNDFKTGTAGEVTISKAGEVEVAIKPALKLREYVINLRSITLVPHDTPADAIDISGEAIQQSVDGSFKLAAADAQINGVDAVLEDVTKDDKHAGGDKKIGWWKDAGTSLVWTINVRTPGKYRVELNYSQSEADEGAKVAIVVGDQKVKAMPKAGKDWLDVKTGNAGEITISKTGAVQVSAIPVSKPHAFVMNLFSIELLPVETPTNAIDIRDEPVKQADNGSVMLTATNAEIDGEAVRLDGENKKFLAWSNNRDSFIKWPIRIDRPGTFSVEMTYSLGSGNTSEYVELESGGQVLTTAVPQTAIDRSKVDVTVGGQTVAITLKAGQGWDDFKTGKFGEISLPQGDNLEVVLSSPEPLGTAVMHLRSVSLVPVP